MNRQKIVDLFTDDGPSVEEADRGVYKGKEGIKRYFIDLLGGGPGKPQRPGWLSILFQLQGVVTINPDGKTATGRWYGMGMEAKPTVSLHEGELRQTWINGIYENEYVKEEGKWKFKKLFFNLVFRTPYEEGWLKCPVIGQNDRIRPSSPMPRPRHTPRILPAIISPSHLSIPLPANKAGLVDALRERSE